MSNLMHGGHVSVLSSGGADHLTKFHIYIYMHIHMHYLMTTYIILLVGGLLLHIVWLEIDNEGLTFATICPKEARMGFVADP